MRNKMKTLGSLLVLSVFLVACEKKWNDFSDSKADPQIIALFELHQLGTLPNEIYESTLTIESISTHSSGDKFMYFHEAIHQRHILFSIMKFPDDLDLRSFNKDMVVNLKWKPIPNNGVHQAHVYAELLSMDPKNGFKKFDRSQFDTSEVVPALIPLWDMIMDGEKRPDKEFEVTLVFERIQQFGSNDDSAGLMNFQGASIINTDKSSFYGFPFMNFEIPKYFDIESFGIKFDESVKVKFKPTYFNRNADNHPVIVVKIISLNDRIVQWNVE